MANNPKPIELHMIDGKTHLSKEQIEERKNAEIKLGEAVFKKTSRILSNDKALAKWNEITDLYIEAGVGFVSSSDIGIIERYCITFADYYNLVDLRTALWNAYKDNIIVYSEMCEEHKLDQKLERKGELLIKMEDRLFLNPVAKIRAIAPKKEQKQTELEKNGFDNV
jgi:phage terminase small subunit